MSHFPFDRHKLRCILQDVSRLKKYIAIALLILWGPATMHCLLENFNIPALEFLSCCLHTDQAPHHDDECQGDECAVVETGHYMVEDHSDLLTYPPLLCLCLSCTVTEVESSLLAGWTQGQGVSPPEFQTAWQFYQRTVAPVRAPSFIS